MRVVGRPLRIAQALVSLLCLFTACAGPAAKPAPTPAKPMPPLPTSCPGYVAPTESQPQRILVSRGDPSFPERARKDRVQGWACLTFTVTAEGAVRDARVLSSEPAGYFEDAALESVRHWTYQPAATGTPGMLLLLKFAISPDAPP